MSFLKHSFKIVLIGLFVLSGASCKKYLEIDPPTTQLSPKLVFSTNEAATSAVIGIYSRMISSGGGIASGSLNSFTSLGGLSADEFTRITNSTGYLEFAQNSLLPTTSIISTNIWNSSYQYIYTANAILEGLEDSENITPTHKNQLQGEAKFIRAFFYFYLTNLFGDVPLHLTTDYRANTSGKRTPQSDVYEQIIYDLKDAQNLLSTTYETICNSKFKF